MTIDIDKLFADKVLSDDNILDGQAEDTIKPNKHVMMI